MRNRKSKPKSETNQERWLISYADFMTLLFAFFTVMYATSEKDLDEAEKFQESVKKNLISAGAFGGSGQKIAAGDKHSSPIAPPIPTFQRVPEPVQKSQDDLIEALEKELTEQNLKVFILDIMAEDQSVKVSLAGDALFDRTDQIKDPLAQRLLLVISNFLKSISNPVIVEGHYAESQVSKRILRSLAAKRALRVLDYLVEEGGLSENRTTMMAFGSTQPLVQENSKNTKRYNQRVNISIQFDERYF